MNCRSFIKNDQDILQEKETNSCLFPGIIGNGIFNYDRTHLPLLPQEVTVKMYFSDLTHASNCNSLFGTE